MDKLGMAFRETEHEMPVFMGFDGGCSAGVTAVIAVVLADALCAKLDIGSRDLPFELLQKDSIKYHCV